MMALSPGKIRRCSAYVAALAMVMAQLTPAGASNSAQSANFADPAFERVWQRTDLPVKRGLAVRTWFWGPEPGKSLREGYQKDYNGAFAVHLVQYFDKARMEINDSNADRNSPWYVTNGLLTVELIAGEAQVGGPTAHQPLPPAEIPLASDLNDNSAPTYRSFRAVADVPGNGGHDAVSAVGQPATATIDRAGKVGSDPSRAALGAPVKYAYFEPLTHHNVVEAFWDFLNGTDLVYENGQTKLRLLSEPWFYATGYPISEAYWSRVSIAGKPTDVLIQAFQRRVLTYTPTNPAGWKVQMANIGQHYSQWRYGAAPAPVPPAAHTSQGRIAFVSDRTGSGEGIFTMMPDGSQLRQVAKTPGHNYRPRWVGGSKQIAYYNLPGGLTQSQLDRGILPAGSRIFFTPDEAGGGGTALGATFAPDGGAFPPRWTVQSDPDQYGAFLVFRGKVDGSNPGLFIANMASDAAAIPVRRLTTGEWDRQPAWNHNGQIAYASGTAADNSQIWVINADGTGKHRLTAVLTGQHDQEPAWSPDGKNLLYVSDGGTGRYDIMTISVDGVAGPSLTGGNSSSQRSPAYSPDGNWLTFSSDRSGNSEIVVTPADGSLWTDIGQSPAADTQPNWGP